MIFQFLKPTEIQIGWILQEYNHEKVLGTYNRNLLR